MHISCVFFFISNLCRHNLALRFMLLIQILYIDCLCSDMLVHNIASSKTTVDLKKAKGMLLFNSVLVELEHSGGGGRKLGQTDGSLNYYPTASHSSSTVDIRWNCFLHLLLIMSFFK